MTTSKTPSINFISNYPYTPVIDDPIEPAEQLPNQLDDFELETFSKIILEKAQETMNAPLLTSGATGTQDTISDISFLFRIFMPEHASTEAAGFTTGVNTFQGARNTMLAAERFEQAKSISDRGGMIEAAISTLCGASQSAGGAAYAGYRGTMIAIDTSSLQAATPLGRAAYILGLIGNIAFTVFYTMLGIWGGYGLVKDWQFSIGMKKNDTALFDFLIRKVTADPKTILDKLNELPPEQLTAFKDKLADTALSKFTSQFLKWQRDLITTATLVGTPLTEQQVKGVFKALFASKEAEFIQNGVRAASLSTLGLKENEVEGFNFSTLELIGFKLEEARRQTKKEAKFSRAASGDCTHAVKKAADRGLGECLQFGNDLVKASANETLKTLKGNIDSANTKNKWIHGVMIPIAILGIASTVLGFFPLSAVMSIVLITVTVLLVLTMMGTDGFFMWNGWKHGGVPGQYDKLYLALVSLAMVTAIAVSVGVTLGFGLALMPMYMSLGIGAASLTLSGYAYHRIDQKQKAWDENHPSLEKFQALLDESKNVDETVKKIFKKLPKADRLAIREKYEMKREDTYQELDVLLLDDSGRESIWNKINNPLTSEKELQLLVCGMKKTVKLFWERWAQSKSDENRDRALKLQSSFETVSLFEKELGTIEDELRLDYVDRIGKILKELELEHDDAFEQLKNDVRYVVKRQESLKDLNKVVMSVIEDKQAISGSDQDKELEKVTPLIQHIQEIFQHAQPATA